MKSKQKPASDQPAQPLIMPGEALRRLFMEPLGISNYRIAKDLGVAPIAMSQIIRGSRAISPMMAVKLGEYFGVQAHFWLNLQSLHDLQLAINEHRNGPLVIERCPALEGREIVVKETKVQSMTGPVQQFEVILVTSKSPSRHAQGNGPQEYSSVKPKSYGTSQRG